MIFSALDGKNITTLYATMFFRGILLLPVFGLSGLSVGVAAL